MQISGFNHSANLIKDQSGHQEVSQNRAQFANIWAYQNTPVVDDEAEVNSSSSFLMDTNHGSSNIHLEDYLTPGPVKGSVDLKDIPLLLPTAHNIDTLSKYTEDKFKSLLDSNSIPSPPETIEFDGEGKLILPNDYPYREELKQALADNPDIENALRTTSALASHYAGIMEGAPFREEMMTARSQADQDRIIQKYSYLFDQNRPAKQIIFSFLDDGSMLLREKGADSKSINT